MSSTITEASRVRIDLGRKLLPSLTRETTLAIAIAGSTAAGYAGPKSDLDFIIFDSERD
jgi:predicted nucleotidyltransferase